MNEVFLSPFYHSLDDQFLHGIYKKKKKKKNVIIVWPLTPKIDTATWAFFGLSDMRHGLLKDSDMGHDHFLKSTG